ncbi:MAG: hypothetical protein RBU30_18940 [Polyangia bacterium]|nr:hypothetical protein [Polyangia bacterium]
MPCAALLEDYKDAKLDMTEEEERSVPHRNANDLERCVAELVDHANRAGGVDNITCLLLSCHV